MNRKPGRLPAWRANIPHAVNHPCWFDENASQIQERRKSPCSTMTQEPSLHIHQHLRRALKARVLRRRQNELPKPDRPTTNSPKGHHQYRSAQRDVITQAESANTPVHWSPEPVLPALPQRQTHQHQKQPIPAKPRWRYHAAREWKYAAGAVYILTKPVIDRKGQSGRFWEAKANLHRGCSAIKAAMGHYVTWNCWGHREC